jgi:hypothetical protein
MDLRLRGDDGEYERSLFAAYHEQFEINVRFLQKLKCDVIPAQAGIHLKGSPSARGSLSPDGRGFVGLDNVCVRNFNVQV